MIITGAIQPKIDTGLLFRIGETYDIFGMYFISRFLIRSEDDLNMLFKTLVWVFSIIAAAMIYEKLKRYNPFSILGVNIYTSIRDGKLRCQGPFSNYILAGTVGATSCTWFLTLWKTKARKMVYLGVVSSILITYLSNSSGPIMSLFCLVIGLSAWPYRNNMKTIKSGIIVGLIVVQLFMNAPIWYLIGRIDLTGSSTGWHRAELIDSAIRHLDEWWIFGTTYTRHWMPTGVSWSPNHTDITNQYIKNGVWGGLITMFLFIFMISSSFGAIGRKIKEVGDKNRKHQVLLWILGASLFSHTITFISVRYFDQSIFYYYLLLALIGYATEEKTLVTK